YRTAMKARDGGDDRDFLRREGFERAVSDQIRGVLVVFGRAHGAADVVQQSCKLEQIALARAEAVEPPRRVEQLKGEARHLPRVGLVVAEPPGEGIDTSSPQAGVRWDFTDLRLGIPRKPASERAGTRQPQLTVRNRHRGRTGGMDDLHG